MSIKHKEIQENNYILNSHLNNLFDIEDDEVYTFHKSFFQKLENNYKKNIKSLNDNNSKKSGGENA